MSDEKEYQPIAELMKKIEAQYGKEAVEKTEYVRQKAVFAVNNGLLAEEEDGRFHSGYRLISKKDDNRVFQK